MLPSNYLSLAVKCILKNVYLAEKKVTHRDKEEPMKLIQIIQKVDATDDHRPQDQPLQGPLLK